MTTAKPEPMSFLEARDRLPLFAVGQEVKIERYVGILDANHPMTSEVAKDFRPVVCRIEGIRLAPDVREEYDEANDKTVRVVEYPREWEYLLVTPKGSEDGWTGEAELLAKGYKPAPGIYDEMQEACMAAVAYDAAIQKRAVNGAVNIMDTGGAVAEGDDLDALYADWINKARAVVEKLGGN